MKLSEWLEAKVDIATARFEDDASTRNVVEINQQALVEAIVAIKIIDDRLTRIEAHLGFDPFDLVPQ